MFLILNLRETYCIICFGIALLGVPIIHMSKVLIWCDCRNYQILYRNINK